MINKVDVANDAYMRFRLPKQVKDNFQSVCKAKAINSSELIRQLIIQWMKEQTQADNQQRRITDISNINQ